MRPRAVIPLIGALIGIAGFFAAMFLVGGIAGMMTGFCVFLACATVSWQIWQRGASPEEIRRELEDRVRNSLP